MNQPSQPEMRIPFPDAAPPVQGEATYPHSAERVWKSLTDPAELSQWLLPTNDFSPREDHRFTFQPEGKKPIHCSVVECIPNRRLTLSWQDDTDTPPTLVSFELERLDSETTRVRVTHLVPDALPTICMAIGRWWQPRLRRILTMTVYCGKV